MNKYLFEWDEGNASKILKKHKMSKEMAESVFDDPNRVIAEIPFVAEKRYYCIGADRNRKLYRVVFTVRDAKIRIITAHRCDPNKGRKLGYQYP